jgi:hypothetical protein
LSASVNGIVATLTWTAATDANQSSGLSYNLRLGTSPGGSENASPMSDPLSGYRRFLEKGNAGQRLSWTIRNLSPGTYYWSVQAIDHSLVGSPFAAESSFVVTPAWNPELRFISGLVLTNGQIALTVGGPVRGRAMVESSDDLFTWNPISAAYIYLGDGTATFSQSMSPWPGWRFFRARLVP